MPLCSSELLTGQGEALLTTYLKQIKYKDKISCNGEFFRNIHPDDRGKQSGLSLKRLGSSGHTHSPSFDYDNRYEKHRLTETRYEHHAT
jgi:hypothetical protein